MTNGFAITLLTLSLMTLAANMVLCLCTLEVVKETKRIQYRDGYIRGLIDGATKEEKQLNAQDKKEEEVRT